MTFEFVSGLSIPWHVYDSEAFDKGSYLICGKIDEERTLQVGKLGKISFKPGYYVYVGSAMNSLSARIKRHLKKDKLFRWHIDYIVPHLKDLTPIPIRSSEPLECSLSRALSSIANGYIPSFGCSDCDCDSHLYWFTIDPFESERFVETLLEFRIGRLKKLVKL